MYNSVLVPLDGSHLAEQVLPYVRLLARGLGIGVKLLRVAEPLPGYLTESDADGEIGRVSAAAYAYAGEYLETVAKGLRTEGLQVASVVEEGAAAERIVHEAGKSPQTLVAMVTHGRSGLSRWMLGSVTDKVLHACTNPMLVVRTGPDMPPAGEMGLKSVVVPLDGSEMAEQVLPHVSRLSRALGLEIVLVRVTNMADQYNIYTDHFVAHYDELCKEVDEHAWAYLRQVGARLREEGLSAVREQLLHGYPAIAILDYARSLDNNLVALTTHGRSGVGRWLLGSIADRVVCHCGGPVLVIRAQGQPAEKREEGAGSMADKANVK